MKINRQGCTRIVFIFKNFVIKIPNFTYSWRHFIIGILANIRENETWKYNSGKYGRGLSHLLCPVLWCSWGGWILIMKKAKVLSDEEYILLSVEDHEKNFPGDNKADNYGLLEGRVVKIDYGQ